MTVRLKPETERLVQEEIRQGRVHSVDELIVRGVWSLREEGEVPAPVRPCRSIYDLISQPPFARSELIIERQKDYPRPVSL